MVVVKSYVLDNPSTRGKARNSFSQHFTSDTPVILMAQNNKGYRRIVLKKEIMKFFLRINYRCLPWKRKHIRRLISSMLGVNICTWHLSYKDI